ncbi:hypothetical protein FS749_015038, partial [Ceratobasidium sp. UAMH 11750]
MSYSYKAASTSSTSSARAPRQATPPQYYPTSGPSVASTAQDNSAYTRDQWAAVQSAPVQSPTVISMGSPRSSRSVHWAAKLASTSNGHHQPRHRSSSPVSQTSSTPSLSHSADMEHDDDLRCPSTPEMRPRELKSVLKSPPPKPKAEPLSPAFAAAYSTIGQIKYEVEECLNAFKHPRDLDFVAASSNPNVVPALGFTAKNRPLLEHIQNLEALQAELDDIESYGDHGIRRARKDVVIMIQHEIDG